ncbi:hypothetical protein HNR57_007361 [Streptomyces paradoxus]|uniref:Uncharacterized protein n=1 Tax=Streptomyces paradoxus TaxID=66375 RepID=A0A7W9WM78_9ACTN|nr:hypothetical protein [Streptomyces paradoxus]
MGPDRRRRVHRWLNTLLGITISKELNDLFSVSPTASGDR